MSRLALVLSLVALVILGSLLLAQRGQATGGTIYADKIVMGEWTIAVTPENNLSIRSLYGGNAVKLADILYIERPGTGGYYLRAGHAGDPCPDSMIGLVGDVVQIGDGQLGPSGTCSDSFDFAVGRYADAGTGEVGLEIARTTANAGETGISIRSNDSPEHTVGLKVVAGDLWVTDNDAGARHLLGKITQGKAYEFSNGCRIYTYGNGLKSTCKIQQPLR